MKVLYLGHFLEGSSWSQVAIDNFKALSLYCDVSWRPIIIRPKTKLNIPQGNLNNITVCIQHVLPSYMQKYKIPCVGFYESETYESKNIDWEDNLSLMDEVWVPNNYHVNNSNLFDHVLMRNCTDITKYNKEYPKPIMKDSYKFYNIAELNQRKRISAILLAFHINFNHNDNVDLVLKISSRFGPKETLNTLEEMNYSIVKSLNKKKTIKPIFITEQLTDNQIYGLHQSCDCFVSASHGEAWNLPLMDAMGFNSMIISTDVVDYLGVKHKRIPAEKEYCLKSEQYIQGLHSHYNTWDTSTIYNLGSAMREVFETKPKIVNDMSFCSYETVGRAMYERILKL